MPDKNPQVKLSQDILNDYSSARSEWATQAVEDNEFRNGKQWQDKHIKALRERAQEPIVVNVIHSAVEQAKALLTANQPRFQSTAREDSDTGVGRVFSDLMSWVWDQSEGNSVLKQIIDDYYVMGMGAMCVYQDANKDFGKGEVCLKAISPLDLYVDPASRSPFCDDSAHMMIAKKIMRSQLVSMYPQYEELIASAKQTSYLSKPTETRFGINKEQILPSDRSNRTSGELDDDIELEVLERYTKLKLPHVRTFDTTSGQEKIHNEEQFNEYKQEAAFLIKTAQGDQYATDEASVQQYHQFYEHTGGVYHQFLAPATGQPTIVPGPEEEGSIPGSTTELIPLTKEQLLADGIIESYNILIDRIQCVVSVGDILLYEVIKPVEYYPIVTFMNRHNRNPYPQSDVRLVKGLQEYINKIRSLIVAHASSSTNVKLLIPRGSMNKKQLEQEWGRAGTAVIEYDPELGQPIVAGPVPLPNELYKNEADAKADIEQILGIYALMQGDQGAAPQTYKGAIALDEFGQRRIRSKKDDIEAGLNHIAKVVVQYIQWIYTDQKVIRLLQPNSAPKEVTVNQPIYDDISGVFIGKTNDVTVGKYDIAVVSGSTLPSNRWARFEYYKELYQMGIIDQIELLKQTDVADMEGVLARSGQMQQMQSQVQAQQEEIKKLKGDLQTAQRESLHDRKRVEVKEFEVKLAKAEAKAEMASQL